jgi:hypothetical protein
MSSLERRQGQVSPHGGGGTAQLADVLERVLDKGIVIAGDIRIELLDIELLTVRLRLLVASADKAKEMGIDWWEGDPFVSTRARRKRQGELEERVRRLEGELGLGNGDGAAAAPDRRREEERA